MLHGLLALFIGQIFANSVVPIGTKIASPITGPLLFVFFRFVVSTAFLSLIYLFSQKRRLGVREYKHFVLLGFLLMINVVIFTIGIAYTTVIMSTLLFTMTPILVGIGGHFFLQESFTKQKIVGLFVSLAGVFFLISQSLSGLQKNAFGEPLGNVLICISVLGYSLYIMYSRKVLHKKNHVPIQTTFLTFAFTTLFILVILLIGFLFCNIAAKPLPSTGILGILIVGLGSIVQYLFLQIGVKKTDAFTASLFQYTGPFIAASITIPLLHEHVTVQLVLGGFLIFVGVFIATTYEQLKKNPFNKRVGMLREENRL